MQKVGLKVHFIPIKQTQKDISSYRTLYLHEPLIQAVTQLAQIHGLRFHAVVVSMIQYCLRNVEEAQED